MFVVFLSLPRPGELRMQKLKSHLLRIQSLKVLPLKHGVGQYIAIHAMLTVRDSSLQIFILPVHSPAFFPNLSRIFPVLAVANTGSCVCLQKKRSFCWTQVPVLSDSRNINMLQVMCHCFFWVCVPKSWIEFELWFKKKRLVT